jgi:hypothetical protein
VSFFHPRLKTEGYQTPICFRYENAETAQALENVVTWALENGDRYAQELGYIPLPEDVEQRVQQTVEQELNDTSANIGA